MSVQQILETMTSKEISEWMAYDLTCSPEWQEKFEEEESLRISREMSPEDKARAFKALLGGPK